MKTVRNGITIQKSPHIAIGKQWQWWIGLLLYYCWFQALYNSLRQGHIWAYDSLSNFGFGVACNLLPISIIWWVYIAIVYRWIRIGDRMAKIAFDILAAFVTALCVNYLFTLIFPLFTGFRAHIDWSGTLLNDFLVLMFIEMTFYFKSIMKYQKEVEEMHQQVLCYKYEALKAQVNPHFLFNSLSLLSSLVSLDPPKAKKFIIELGNMYRYILAHEGSELVPVEEEIEFLHSYFQVLEMRYQNKFTVKFEGKAPKGSLIVPYCMQLLIENVIKHNVISSKHPMEVTVVISENEIRISNPLVPRSSIQTSGLGLRYLRGLYASHNKDIEILTENNTFTAVIPHITVNSPQQNDV